MILVDTSVWIDHLHRADQQLSSLLDDDLVMTHSGIIQELAVGSLRQRTNVITLLEALHRAPDLGHAEILHFVERQGLWGRGLSVIDVHLLGAARLAHAEIWTRDKRLHEVAAELGANYRH